MNIKIRRFVSSLTGKNKIKFFVALSLICVLAICVGIYGQFFYRYSETDPLMMGINLGAQKSEEEYAQLETAYSELESKYNALVEFKNTIENEKKEALINSFYMLSDDDKKDVIDNIDTYSLDDIEAKLSIICVRNKVSFDLETEDKTDNQPTVYNLNSGDFEDESTPAWVKAVRSVAKDMK